MRRALSVGLLALAAAAGCHKSDSDSVVVVSVSAGGDITGVTQLQATITLGELSTVESFPATNGTTPVVFPASFSLTLPRSRQGTIEVVVKAVNAAGTTVAMGTNHKDVIVGGQTSLSVPLALPVADDKDAAPPRDSATDASLPDVDRRETAGTGGATAFDGPSATGGTMGSGGRAPIDTRPSTGGGGGSTVVDAPPSTGGVDAIDAGIKGAIDGSALDTTPDVGSAKDAKDGPGGADGAGNVHTLFDFASGTQGWTFNSYQAIDTLGNPIAPINLAVTRVPGVAPPTIGWDGTVGDPPGSLKVTAAFNAYDQQVDPMVNFGSIVQDWSNKEISVRFKIDPATTAGLPQAGLQLMASDAAWKASSRAFPLPTDNAWHTYVLDLNGASGIDTTQIAQLAVQLWTGPAPATGGTTFTPISFTAFIDNVRIDDIPPTVTFQNGQAQGAMTGYAWVAFGVSDAVTSPTCGGAPMSATTPCTTTPAWSPLNALCVSGALPALPASPTSTDFANNWGIAIGVNATPSLGLLGQSFSTIAFAVTGAPLTGLRAQVHREGDDATTNYCLNTSANVTLNLASFNTSCWDNSGIFLTLADVPNLDKVSLEVLPENAPIAVSNLCLTGITFGN